MTVMLSAASTLQWVTGIAGEADETALLNRVDQLPMSERASAPIFLPYLSGERTPHNDANASGAFVGLRHGHTAAHMAYSVIDGVSLGMRDGLDAIRRAGSHVTSLQLVGGGSRSPLWAQLLADSLELEITVGQDSGVGAAIGAARLAQLSQTPCVTADINRVCSRPIVLRRYIPDDKGVHLARRRQSIYRSSYQALRGVYAQAAHS
jgi:xylulokinase